MLGDLCRASRARRAAFFRLSERRTNDLTVLDIETPLGRVRPEILDRKSTRLNSSHLVISYAVFCLKKKNRHVNSEALVTSNAVFCFEAYMAGTISSGVSGLTSSDSGPSQAYPKVARPDDRLASRV